MIFFSWFYDAIFRKRKYDSRYRFFNYTTFIVYITTIKPFKKGLFFLILYFLWRGRLKISQESLITSK